MTVTAARGVTAPFVGVDIYIGVNPPVQAYVGVLWRDDGVSPPVFKKCTSITPVTFASIEGGATPTVDDITVTFDGGGSALAVGDTRSYFVAPYSGTITGWYLTGDPSGSVVIDVWRATGAIPSNANSIAGTEKPTLSSAVLASDTSLTTWTTTFSQGDVFGFEVESATSVTKATLTLRVTR